MKKFGTVIKPSCVAGTHNLKVILRDGGDAEENVVRWCVDCGAIVIDVDYDGRTNRGQYMKMKFPTLLDELI